MRLDRVFFALSVFELRRDELIQLFIVHVVEFDVDLLDLAVDLYGVCD